MKTVDQNRFDYLGIREEHERRKAEYCKASARVDELQDRLANDVCGLSGLLILNLRLRLAMGTMARADRRVQNTAMACIGMLGQRWGTS